MERRSRPHDTAPLDRVGKTIRAGSASESKSQGPVSATGPCCQQALLIDGPR